MIRATQQELQQAHAWADSSFGDISSLPFSFSYTQPSRTPNGLTWRLETHNPDNAKRERGITLVDPDTGLEIRCVSTEFTDFPVVEWTVYFRNSGTVDTPIISRIAAVDTILSVPEGEVTLHHHNGDQCSRDGYEPYRTVVAPGNKLRFAPQGGRPTNFAFPYFNLQNPEGGLILSVGWPGQWFAEFEKTRDNGLRIVAGQESVHLVLRPGEEIRTPLIAMLFWQGGDRHRAQNLWRRWMMAHNMPRIHGELPPPTISGGSSLQFDEMMNANEENQIYFIDRYLENGIPYDYWWMDAGWYPFQNGWWDTGTWEPDLNRFPRGLKAISDHAHAKSLKTLLWFEPERVRPGTWLHQNHAEWLLTLEGEENSLLDLGNPEARQWLTDHVDKVLTENSIDLYRQDFNFDPLPFWRANDDEDRQGITENHHVTGYLAYWDELRRRRPAMLLDSCASGGRRNDLETLRRSVPIHKTDYNYSDIPAKQAFHYNLFQWMPFFGAPVLPCEEIDTYVLRSAMCLWTAIGFDVRRDDYDYALLRKLLLQCRDVAPLYYGDYYPLTDYSREDGAWMAWQFNSPEMGEGMVQVFRRTDSPYESARLRLHDLEPDAIYEIIDFDQDARSAVSGDELVNSGLSVRLTDAPQALLITYRKTQT